MVAAAPCLSVFGRRWKWTPTQRFILRLANLSKAAVWSSLLCLWTWSYYKCCSLINEYTRDVIFLTACLMGPVLGSEWRFTWPFTPCTSMKPPAWTSCTNSGLNLETHSYRHPLYFTEVKASGQRIELELIAVNRVASANHGIYARCRWVLSSLKWKWFCRRRDALFSVWSSSLRWWKLSQRTTSNLFCVCMCVEIVRSVLGKNLTDPQGRKWLGFIQILPIFFLLFLLYTLTFF